MAISIPEFWKLVIESRLLTPEQCQQLAVSFGHAKGAAGQGDATALVEWLVSINAISKYQAVILLAGRAGPFVYGEYRVYERVERDRMAGCFRAVHIPTNHPVLLRFLTGLVTQDARYWQAVVAQTQARANLVEPHLQRIFAAVDCAGFKFLVCEDLPGEGLGEVLVRAGRFQAGDASRAILMSASALARLHLAGQIHADVRPANLWLEPGGNIKLLHDPATFPVPPNLGLDDLANQQRADFFAPEFTQPGKAPDVLTDIYAMGCSFYQLLAGQPPFPGGTVLQKLTRHATEAILPLEPLGVSPHLAQLVAYLMAKNPAVRYQEAVVVAEQLQQLIDPATLDVRPSPMPATLAVFEKYLRDRPATTSGIATAAMAPAVNVMATPAAPASSGAAIGSMGPSVNVASAPPRPKHTAGTDRLRATTKKGKNTAMIGGASVGAAGLILIVVLIVLNGSKTNETGSTNQQGSKVEGSPEPSDASENLVAHTSGGKSLLPKVPVNEGKSKVPTSTSDKQKSATAEHTGDVPEARPRQEVVADDGQLLWASPTTGKEINLEYMPPGAHVYLHARPAALVASAEGTRVMQALGPAFDATRKWIESLAGVRFQEIEELAVGLYAKPQDLPRPAFVVRLREAVPTEELLQRWGRPEESTKDSIKFYTGKDWSYFLPEKAGGRVFVICAPAEMDGLVETRAAPPVLRRELARLHKVSDGQRHFTALFAPSFLFSEIFTEGRRMFFGETSRLQEPLDWFVRKDELQAGMVSAHFEADTFLELRLVGTLTNDKFSLAKSYRDRLEQVPDAIFDYIASFGSNPYWEKVRLQYPNMIRYLHKMTRIGAEDDVATINCVLPGSAAHNLVFGSEMVLVSRPGAAAVAAKINVPAASPYQTVEDVLFKFKTKVSFESKSLEFALQDIAVDVNESIKGLPFEFKIKILGDDLKLDGITRNQTVRDFMHADKTVAEILTAMVLKANPVTTVKDPSETDQKLLWVIDKDPDDPSKPIVLITTRQASEQRKYKLPPMFQPK